MSACFTYDCECILCYAEIGQAFFKFFAINFGALVKSRILNSGGGWNGEQFGNPKVVRRKAARYTVAQGKQAHDLAQHSSPRGLPQGM